MQHICILYIIYIIIYCIYIYIHIYLYALAYIEIKLIYTFAAFVENVNRNLDREFHDK